MTSEFLLLQVWPGTKCAAGLTCYKTSRFYYACNVKPPKKTGAEMPHAHGWCTAKIQRSALNDVEE